MLYLIDVEPVDNQAGFKTNASDVTKLTITQSLRVVMLRLNHSSGMNIGQVIARTVLGHMKWFEEIEY